MPVVSVVKGPRCRETVYKSLDFLGGLKDVVANADRVLVKINFITAKTFETGVTSDPLVVDALLQWFKELHGEVAVVESDSSLTSADKAYRVTGLDKVCEQNHVKFINLRREEAKVRLEIPDGEVLKHIVVPRIILDAAVVSLAKLKTHNETGVTLGMKNMFGLLPDKLKFRYHLKDVNKVIVDINTVLRSRLTVIDGFYALEGIGPISGNPVQMGLMLAGRDPVATDATACRVMGIDPYEIYHIRRAYEKGLGEIDPARVEVVGEVITNVQKKFKRT